MRASWPTRPGSIPAHAGEPSATYCRARAVGKDHGSIPAHAGEPARQCDGTRCAALHNGLSPHTRGNRPRVTWLPVKSTIGSIPAHAGEPVAYPAESHPSAAGLSPHTRGNQRRRSNSVTVTSCGVYPRTRGGTRHRAAGYPALMGRPGLSPHTRGNLRNRPRVDAPVNGSIPAHAGEPSNKALGPPLVKRVYPRTRGGTTPTESWSTAHAGERLAPSPHRLIRSIPAHAGEPELHWRGRTDSNRVYPRTRGGTTIGSVTGLQSTGSIPAHAGEPRCRSG